MVSDTMTVGVTSHDELAIGVEKRFDISLRDSVMWRSSVPRSQILFHSPAFSYGIVAGQAQPQPQRCEGGEG